MGVLVKSINIQDAGQKPQVTLSNFLASYTSTATLQNTLPGLEKQISFLLSVIKHSFF